MTAALGTLVFLLTIWAIVVAIAATLEESSGKVIAALRGKPPVSLAVAPVRVRSRMRIVSPVRATAVFRPIDRVAA